MDKALLSLIKSQVMQYTPCRRLPTGSLSFDLACGVNDGMGGLPRSLITELAGDSGNGKSTLALITAAEASKVGNVVYIDMEHKLSHEWAASLGAHVGENFTLLWPEDGTQALNDILNLLDHNDDLGLVLVVLDSIGSLDPMGRQYEDKEARQRKNFRDVPIGRLARLLTPFFEQARPLVASSGAALLMVNHIRANIGGYGASTYTPGGYAKDFSTALDIRVQAPTNIEKAVNREKTLMGRYLNGRTTKNQTAFHPHEFKIPILFQPRVMLDRSLETVEVGIQTGILVDEDGRKPDGQKMIYFGDHEVGSGKTRAAGTLDKNRDLREEIRQQILAPKVVNALAEEAKHDLTAG